MRILADENQHPFVVAHLRGAGYDVEWIRESSQGAKDPTILRREDIGSLVFVTDDRDFGDLIFNHGYPAPRAILYNRLRRTRPDVIGDRLLRLLRQGGFENCMTTITKDGERMKPFPSGVSNG